MGSLRGRLGGALLLLGLLAGVVGCSDPTGAFPPEDTGEGVVDESIVDESVVDDDVTAEDVEEVDAGFVDRPADRPTDRPRDTGTDRPRDVGTDDRPDLTPDVGFDSGTPDVGFDVGELDVPVDRGAPDVPSDRGFVDTAPRSCSTSGECNDGISCTTDSCRGGLCVHATSSSACATGSVCDPRVGCVLGATCRTDADCVDSDPCTVDEYCSASGRCRVYMLDDDYDYFAPTACGGGDCDDSRYGVYPGATESCNGVDDDCDGLVDEEGTTALCGGGTCTGGRCVCSGSGLSYCSGRCYDTTSDPLHCGSCTTTCSSSATCTAGRCVCGGGRTACGSSCVDTGTDRFNCGACGVYCGVGVSCIGGRCMCSTGLTSCTDGCVSLQTDDYNCGACNTRCRFDQTCSAGVCRCDTGTTECAGACVEVSSDARNCGACGMACAAGLTCTAGVCGCRSGQILCGSGSTLRCVDPTSDPANCGACGTACMPGAVCGSGRCACPATAPTTCGGRCVATASDASNCGACGTACTAPTGAVPTCVTGVCGSVCAPGRGDCDGNAANGCETDTLGSAAHCGVCGRACPGGAACTLGACPGDGWARSFGGIDGDQGNEVATDAGGNVYVVGDMYSAGSIGTDRVTGAGGMDGFLLALGPTGAYRWGRALGGASSDEATSVAVDRAGNVYVVGIFAGTADFGGGPLTSVGSTDIYVASYTSAGTYRWARRYGSSYDDAGLGVAVDASGNLAVSGYQSSPTDYGGGLIGSTDARDGFVLSLSDAGAFRWATLLGGSGSQTPTDVAFDAAGNAVVIGHFTTAALIGTVAMTASGSYDVMVAGLSPTGAVRWARRYGGTGQSLAFGVAVDAAGGSYVTGRYNSGVLVFGGTTLTTVGGADAYVAAFDAAGVPRWARNFGSRTEDGGTNIALDGTNLWVGGWFSGTADLGGGSVAAMGTYDAFLVGLSTGNTFRSARRFGGTGTDETLGVTTIAGAPVLTGRFSNTAIFGMTTLTTATYTDAFVARLTP